MNVKMNKLKEKNQNFQMIKKIVPLGPILKKNKQIYGQL